jgi:CheY-like chemotaxis protein
MSKRRVLVVEDKPDSRWALAELLRDDGHNVLTASNGAEALSALDAFGPDVVIADLRMPGMNGLELMEIVHDRRAECRLILTSVYTPPTHARGLPVEFVPKPIDPTRLKTLLEVRGPEGRES